MKPISRTGRRRLVAAAALAGFALLVMGAVHFSQEAKAQSRRAFGRVAEWQEIAEAQLTAVPGGARPEWREAASQCPLLLVQACCRTSAPPDGK